MVSTMMEWIMTEQKPRGARYSANSSQATLWQFKSVIESGDLRYLLILDDYSVWPDCELDVLESIWQGIYQEFSDITGGNRADLWLLKTKQLMIMRLDLERQSSLLRLIKLFPHPELIELANFEGFSIDLEDFNKTFEKAYTRLMGLKRNINITEKDQEPEEAEQSLDETIVTLEKFQGYQFDEHKMSVRKFANILKKYKDAEVHS